MKSLSFGRILEKKESKNAGWLIGSRIIKAIFSLVVSIVTARYLGPANYGIIGYATTFVSFFSVVCTLGFDAVIIKFFYDDPEKEGQIIGSALFFRGLASILSILAIFVLISIVDRGEKTTIKVVVLCSIGLLFQIFDSLNFWFQSRYNSKVVAISTLIAYIAISIYKILLFILGKDVYWFAISTSVDYMVLASCLLLFYKKYKGPKFSISLRKGFTMLKSSYHYILSGLMVAIYGQTDRLMLKQMIGETEVGYYTLAVQVCSMWVFVLSAVIDSMYPTILLLHEKNKEAYEKKNRMLYSFVFYISVVVSLAFQVLAKPAITIVYGKEYINAITPLLIITWYTAFSYLGVARNAWLVCENKQKYLKYMYAIAVFANIGLNLLLIPQMGSSGAALASLITQILTSILLPLLIPQMRPNAKLMIQAIMLTDFIKKKHNTSSDIA